MSIDINGLNNNAIPARVSGSGDDSKVRQQAQQTPVATETGQASTGDTISLSEGAKQLGKLSNTAPSAPVIDTQRVEAVKKAIENGSYEIDPVKVADRLMQFESMLKPKA